MTPTVLFRVDASAAIGTGHVMRCLTLADALRRSEVTSAFISRELDGHLCDMVAERGFEVHRLEKPKAGDGEGPSSFLGTTWEADAAESRKKIKEIKNRADWLVIDHYSLDREWERCLRPSARRLMVIDDLANRPHDCDLLLDQNYYNNLESRYDKLVPPDCTLLLGPKYVLLRQEFLQARSRTRARSGRVKRALIFLGGADPENITARVLSVFTQPGAPKIILDVVVGNSNPHKMAIKELCSRIPLAHYYCQISNISDLMLSADIAIGAGGSTTWERCALGLPTLTIVIAENQFQTTKDMAELGVIWNLGRSSELDDAALRRAIQTAMSMPERLHRMSEKALELMSQFPEESGSAVAAHLFRDKNNVH